MKKESLVEFKAFLISNADKMNIDEVDKLELILNVSHLVEPDDYKENIDILKRHDEKRRVLRYGKESKQTNTKQS